MTQKLAILCSNVFLELYSFTINVKQEARFWSFSEEIAAKMSSKPGEQKLNSNIVKTEVLSDDEDDFGDIPDDFEFDDVAFAEAVILHLIHYT